MIQCVIIMCLYIIWETILSGSLTKMNANRQNWFCSLVLSFCDRRIWIAIDENAGWQTKHELNDNVFDNWSTKDEIERSIRTFQSVRDEIENTFFLVEWTGDKNGRENVGNHVVLLRSHESLYPISEYIGSDQGLRSIFRIGGGGGAKV